MRIERSEPRLRSRYDLIFFQAFAVFAGVAVFLGFMHSYSLPGGFTVPAWKTNMFPPHPLIVHIHGVLFSSWSVLIVPTSLVTGHRMNWHRRLGQATTGLAGLMLVVGFVFSSESLARNFPPGDPRVGIAATNFLGVLIFPLPEFCFGNHRRLCANRVVYGWSSNRNGTLHQGSLPQAFPVLISVGECIDVLVKNCIQAGR